MDQPPQSRALNRAPWRHANRITSATSRGRRPQGWRLAEGARVTVEHAHTRATFFFWQQEGKMAHRKSAIAGRENPETKDGVYRRRRSHAEIWPRIRPKAWTVAPIGVHTAS